MGFDTTIAIFTIVCFATFLVTGDKITTYLSARKKHKELIEQGQTPYVTKNYLTIFVAWISQLVVIFTFYFLTTLWLPENIEVIYIIPLLVFALVLLYELTAYLVVWGLWKIFVVAETKKARKEVLRQLKERKEKETGL